MRSFCSAFFAVIALLITTLALIADQAAQAKKTDAEKLLGTWRVVQGRCDGEDLPKEFLSLMRLAFDKKGLSLFSLGRWQTRYPFKVSGRENIEIALLIVGSEDPIPALYKLEATGQLAICANLDAKGPRPTFFTAEKDSGRVLLILERATPAQGKLTEAEFAKYKDAFYKLNGFDRLRENLRRLESGRNLIEIANGFFSFADSHAGAWFPAHSIYSKDGKTPLLSWRVTLLEDIEDQEALFKEFRLDEPWDSEHNKTLIPKMPDFYAAPGDDKKDGLTYYQVFTGAGTLFQGNKKPDAIENILANRLLVAEAGTAVIWTKPADIDLPADDKQMPALGGILKNGMNLLFANSKVQFYDGKEMDAALLRALIKGERKLN